MFGKRKLDKAIEELNLERIKFKCYEPIDLNGESSLPEILEKLNGAIVLLQSEHMGKYYHRGELSYSKEDSEVIQFKNNYNQTIRKRIVHLHDITGLMRETN